MNSINGFIIRNKPWMKWFFITLLILSVSAAIIIGSLILAHVMPIETAAFLIITVFAAIASILGLYAYLKEAFILKDGMFTYRKVFRKSQSVKIENISSVVFKGNGTYKITFLDKDGKVAISFLDDGNAFKDNLFIATLTHHNIPIKYI